MSKAIFFSLCFLICTAVYAAASAAGKRPADAWNYYHFDGLVFTAGPAVDGSAFVAVRQNVRPVILTTQTSQIDQTVLPDGAGAVTGICYLHGSGGKLGSGSSFKPYPRVPVLISSGSTLPVTVQTDDHGYFVAVLPAGAYSVGSGPFSARITVEQGKTTLIPVRAGKRMVD